MKAFFKKITVIPFIVLFIFTAALPSLAKSEASIVSAYGSPEIDGVIDEIWDRAEAQPVDNVDKEVIPSDSKTTGSVRTMWDEDYFYVLVEVDKHGVQVYKGEGGETVDVEFYDCAEVTFSLKGDFTVTDIPNSFDWYTGDIRVFPDGSKTGLGQYYLDNVDDVLAVMKITATDKYVAEYAFPWLDIEPQAGMFVTMEIQINDHSGPVRDGLVTWASEEGCWGWNKTSVHGTVFLGNENSVVPEIESTDPPEPISTPEQSESEPDTEPDTSEPLPTEPSNTSKVPDKTEPPVTDESSDGGYVIPIILGAAAAAAVIAFAVYKIIKSRKNKN